MFGTLLESRARCERKGRVAAVSVTVHAALIVLGVVATAGGTPTPEGPPEVLLTPFQTPRREPPPPPPERRPTPVDPSAAPVPFGSPVLPPLLGIPDSLPPIDLTVPPTDPDEWVQRGVPGGRRDGVVGAESEGADLGRAFFEFEVEKPVVPAPGTPSPRYPDILRSAGVEGAVLAQFVVDTAGRADMESFKALESSHELFTAAVRAALPGMRFLPAEVGGKKVSQLVQQPFVFSIAR